ncbi:hypothetical protein [Streptomyces sp. S465]|uniref:hypothetical protein n=1 Tax=Streptomyces sp. S465 TaxID=2979468 RepID=UPI0022A83134|nr:hypothetical protein [Streptomyces sp. S465]WAP55919.1 hypothetical protein N6H00_13575 [Streptomyces sp. S465]
MKRVISVFAAGTATAVLAACGTTSGGDAGSSPSPSATMPGNVPTKPEYADADAVVEALEAGGVPCEITRRSQGGSAGGSGLGCASVIDGTKFENDIQVLNPKKFSRDEIGESIASHREPPTSHTIVAAGHWFVWVTEPRFANRIAAALGGVVLPPEKTKIPEYPLPDIPRTPRYRSVGALADDLAAAVGCGDRKQRSDTVLTCTTGADTGSSNCATLALHASDADRDAVLREAIAYKGVPATLVTAGNWTVNLCDYDLGSRVADALHGTVVSYDGG